MPTRLGLFHAVSATCLFSVNEAARQRRSTTAMRPTVSRWVCRPVGIRPADRGVGTTTGHTGQRDSVSLRSTQSSVSYRWPRRDRACTWRPRRRCAMSSSVSVLQWRPATAITDDDICFYFHRDCDVSVYPITHPHTHLLFTAVYSHQFDRSRCSPRSTQL